MTIAIQTTYVICPNSAKCKALICSHSKPHEPIEFGGDLTCFNDSSCCPLLTGKCVPFQPVTSPGWMARLNRKGESN